LGFHFLEELVVKRRRSFGLLAVIALGFLAAGPAAAGGQNAAPAGALPPGLQGAWQLEGQSAMLVATRSYAAFFGVDGLPALATYTIDGDRITLQPYEGARSFSDAILEDDLGIKSTRSNPPVTLDRVAVQPETLRFTAPDGITRTWRRLE
jgi:hypothetical protein